MTPAWKTRSGYPKPDCEQQWARYRKLWRVSIGMFLLWIPYGWLLIEAVQHLPRRAADPVFVIFGGTYLVTWVVFCNLVNAFRCPRCGGRFSAWGLWGLGHNAFVRQCRNCGLKKRECFQTSL